MAKLMDHRQELEGEVANMWRCTAVAALVHGLPDSPFTEEDVLHAIGTLQTNTVSTGVPGHSQGLGLYPTFSLLSHSCTANARYQVLADRGLVLRAQVPIKQGEEVTIHYMTPMLGTVARRTKIRKNWFFDCCCPRCSDPTELGTFSSGLVCQECRREGRGGILLPRQALEYSSTWSCSQESCISSETAERVETMVGELEQQLEVEGEGPEGLQSLLVSWSERLHPHHYLVMLVKRRLLAALHLSSSHGKPSRSGDSCYYSSYHRFSYYCSSYYYSSLSGTRKHDEFNL